MTSEAVRLTTLATCAGCAGKFSQEELSTVLGMLPPPFYDPAVLVGTETGDDAAVYKINDETALVLTVDFFPPIVDDPYDYGMISATNSMSDVFAMGGKPICALTVAAFPRELGPKVIARVLEGGQAATAAAGIAIVGGHTLNTPEPKYGLAVIGTVVPGRQVTNVGARPGDLLVLTKPLGTGVITTAGRAGKAPDNAMRAAVESMIHLNRDSAEAMTAVGVSCATDITGFGLAGHLHKMLHASGVSARIVASALPTLPLTRELAEAGFISGGAQRNEQMARNFTDLAASATDTDFDIFCDAQTSGGLLISVPARKSAALIDGLKSRRALASAVIGEVLPGGNPGRIQLEH